jgi:uncharacterized membrane protein YcaP (DUF421 family)
MLERISNTFSDLLGLGLKPEELMVQHVCLRAIVIFFIALIIVRLGAKRFLAKLSAFDAILGFILASMLSRAINGSAPFFPTIAGGLVVVLLHRFMAYMAMRYTRFGSLIKGDECVLVDHGMVQEKRLRKNCISEKDLMEELRLNGNAASLHNVKRAILERSGQISVVKET